METETQRTDRQLQELLSELRVALPGAQFLFAFLLTVPFASRFRTVGHDLRVVFYACLLCTIAATILLMAPSVYHRVRWQHGDMTAVMRTTHRMFLVGVGFLGVAMTTAVFFVSDILLGTVAAVLATSTSLLLIGLTWCALPLHRRFHPSARR